MGEFLAVHMVDPAKVGDRFTMWPLHMTLLPWFEAPDVSSVLTAFRARLEHVAPLEVSVASRAYFGQRKLPVKLVHRTAALQQLHEILLQAVLENGWPLQGRYTGEHFKPHVTQKAGRDATGMLVVDAVYIAERQSQGYREIVGKIAL